jgi:hypothetical protein
VENRAALYTFEDVGGETRDAPNTLEHPAEGNPRPLALPSHLPPTRPRTLPPHNSGAYLLPLTPIPPPPPEVRQGRGGGRGGGHGRRGGGKGTRAPPAATGAERPQALDLRGQGDLHPAPKRRDDQGPAGPRAQGPGGAGGRGPHQGEGGRTGDGREGREMKIGGQGLGPGGKGTKEEESGRPLVPHRARTEFSRKPPRSPRAPTGTSRTPQGTGTPAQPAHPGPARPLTRTPTRPSEPHEAPTGHIRGPAETPMRPTPHGASGTRVVHTEHMPARSTNTRPQHRHTNTLKWNSEYTRTGLSTRGSLGPSLPSRRNPLFCSAILV